MSYDADLFENFGPTYRGLWEIAQDDKTSQYPRYGLVAVHGINEGYILGVRPNGDHAQQVSQVVANVLEAQDELKSFPKIATETAKSLYFGYNLASRRRAAMARGT
jgi:hypothetical protein